LTAGARTVIVSRDPANERNGDMAEEHTPWNNPDAGDEHAPADPHVPPTAPPLDAPTADAQTMRPSKDECNMAMLCHLLAIFTWFVGPLIIWLIRREESRYVDQQGKEALNFQITVSIAYAVCFVLFIAAAIIPFFVCIVAPIGVAVSAVDLVFCILAAVAASKGEPYRYPASLRMIS
jgi:hypothetical protein